MATPHVFGKSIIATAPMSAPGSAARFLRLIIDSAIEGNALVPGARQVAAEQLEQRGDVEAAIDTAINQHMILAGAQGFLSNIGGVTTVLIGAPTNMVGLAILHSRLTAVIAHLRGYDLDDSRVRHAILTTLLGQKIVDDLVATGELPGTPLVLATAPGIDHELEQLIAARVVTAIASVGGGKALIGLGVKRIPIIGGGVGLIADGWNTRAIGRYAREQFISRRLG